MRKGFSGIGIVLGVVFVTILSVFGYKFGKEAVKSINTSVLNGIIGKRTTGAGLFSGKLTRIQEDLQIFKKSEYDELNDLTPSTVYFSAGVYRKGKYKGYERIVGIRDPMGPGDALVYLFATKDRKTYILNETDQASKLFPDTDWRNPFNVVDKTKISKIIELPSEHPQVIPLDDTFALYKTTVVTENVKSGNISKEGYDIYENIIGSNFQTSFEPLSLNIPALTFFGYITLASIIPPEWEEDAKVQAQLREKYIKGTTRVVVVDTSGLPYNYTLTRRAEITSYESAFKKYEEAAKIYEKERVRFENKEIDKLPDYPISPSLPNLRFMGKDVKGGGEVFDTYDIAVPYICGVDVDIPVIQHIADSEFVSFGTVFGKEIFTLKDTEHPFYKLAYRNKMLMSAEEFDAINKDRKKMTYAEYVAKHPLLFFKDYWNRWVAVGEYEYKMIGGCGKPVLYLYPEEPMNVSVSFVRPMDFSLTIPRYYSDWYVRATPEGVLTDLVSEQTDCSGIDDSLEGSEYAKTACQQNAYPYLYWSGNRIGMSYPSNMYLGWIVSSGELVFFLTGKLDEIGFTWQEKNDFLSYWVPMMLKKNAPWYHIRFLQTSDMNAFVPMDIRPKPDRFYRLFMDWRPLRNMPSYPVVGQQLDVIVRKGFTVVEWGGLKQ